MAAAPRPGHSLVCIPQDGMLPVMRRLWQSLDVTMWVLAAAESMNPEQRTLAEGLAAVFERAKPPHLDFEQSSAIVKAAASSSS